LRLALRNSDCSGTTSVMAVRAAHCRSMAFVIQWRCAAGSEVPTGGACCCVSYAVVREGAGVAIDHSTCPFAAGPRPGAPCARCLP